MPMGSKRLQQVIIETLGGEIKRVVNINESVISSFTLPKELRLMSDQETASVFAGNFISAIDYDTELLIEGKTFINAKFISFSGKTYPVILEKDTGRPLHLQGLGYRNELASTWVNHTIKNRFYLGENRMVGVNTISESLKENELLFSVQQLTSWLTFYDNYLPIFKQIIEVEDSITDTWDYHLFELRETAKEKEYIAVEKVPPYRILADKKTSEYHPRIVKSKKKSIKSPEEMTALQKFFLANSASLVSVE